MYSARHVLYIYMYSTRHVLYMYMYSARHVLYMYMYSARHVLYMYMYVCGMLKMYMNSACTCTCIMTSHKIKVSSLYCMEHR